MSFSEVYWKFFTCGETFSKQESSNLFRLLEDCLEPAVSNPPSFTELYNRKSFQIHATSAACQVESLQLMNFCSAFVALLYPLLVDCVTGFIEQVKAEYEKAKLAMTAATDGTREHAEAQIGVETCVAMGNVIGLSLS